MGHWRLQRTVTEVLERKSENCNDVMVGYYVPSSEEMVCEIWRVLGREDLPRAFVSSHFPIWELEEFAPRVEQGPGIAYTTLACLMTVW